MPSALTNAWRRSADFPIPRSPTRTSAPPRPCRAPASSAATAAHSRSLPLSTRRSYDEVAHAHGAALGTRALAGDGDAERVEPVPAGARVLAAPARGVEERGGLVAERGAEALHEVAVGVRRRP